MNFAWLTHDALILLWRGVQLTLLLTLITSLLALLLGIAAGTMRLARRWWLRLPAAIYIEIHRNVPALVLIIFWAFAVPNLLPPAERQTFFFDNAAVDGITRLLDIPLAYYALAATLALTLNTSAYIAELFRAGVGTIPAEYAQAARTLGATRAEVLRGILLPQGVRAAFPAISTRLIHNMKNTALAAFVAVPELFHSTQTAVSKSFRAVEFLIVAALLYLILSAAMAALLRAVERRLQSPPSVAGTGMRMAHG